MTIQEKENKILRISILWIQSVPFCTANIFKDVQIKKVFCFVSLLVGFFFLILRSVYSEGEKEVAYAVAILSLEIVNNISDEWWSKLLDVLMVGELIEL